MKGGETEDMVVIASSKLLASVTVIRSVFKLHLEKVPIDS